MSVIPGLRKQKQEDHELGVSLGYRNKKKECLEHDFIPDYTLVQSSGGKFTAIFPQLAMVKHASWDM